jgi:hypothetical protein
MEYKKQYLPGYSGHVPRKNDLFGITAGDANQILIKSRGADSFFASGGQRPTNWNQKNRNLSTGAHLKADALKYTNWSKKAPNWICGPKHEIRTQHIPGYKGHVHGVVPENMHGKAFARHTATAINKNTRSYKSSQHASPRETFTSMNKKEFSPNNFRRYLERPDMQSEKDYSDYAKCLNDEMVDKNAIPKFNDTIANKTGSQFFNSRKKIRSTRFSMTSHDFHPDEADVKPRLLESKVVNQKGFFNMSNGFQKVFANDKKDRKLSIPIAGYSGHQRGDKSQNYYGRTFRDSAMQSKRLQRTIQKVQ